MHVNLDISRNQAAARPDPRVPEVRTRFQVPIPWIFDLNRFAIAIGKRSGAKRRVIPDALEMALGEIREEMAG